MITRADNLGGRRILKEEGHEGFKTTSVLKTRGDSREKYIIEIENGGVPTDQNRGTPKDPESEYQMTECA